MEPAVAIERLVTESYGRLRAVLAARTGDFAAAEDALGDALHAALNDWPQNGVPRLPEAWLLAVARRRLIDEHRRRETRATHEAVLQREAEGRVLAAVDALADLEVFPDERLKLLFTCAHPAIDPALHTPLMLQIILGLDAERIASAFLVAPAAMSQRLVRAKTKIRRAGIPFRVPEAAELPGRLEAVLAAVYAAYGLDWEASAGSDSAQRGLLDEAVWLARALVQLLPDEPEALGLLALVLHCEARRAARRDADGEYVPLSAQDTGRWSRPLLAEAENLLGRAAALGWPGRFQLEAAIQSAHASRAVTSVVPWAGIVLLYQRLLAIAPSVGGQVACAAALHQAGDVRAAEAMLASVAPQTVASYQPYWAVRAQILLGLGKREEARTALERAAGLTQDATTRRFLWRLAASHTETPLEQAL